MKRTRAIATLALSMTILLAAQALPVGAVTPISKNDWAQNQLLQFRWRVDAVPPDWLKKAVRAAADDSTRSRDANAGIISYKDGVNSWVAYTPELPTVAAIAYASRRVPDSYKVWFRPHGHSFDWGVLRWCEFFDAPPNGCFDAQTAALHEFGHVQGLGHSDAGPPLTLMHKTSLAKARLGWDQHDFGSCDVAAMQTRYEALTPATPISSCLSLATSLGFAASRTSVPAGGSVTFTAQLAIGDAVAYPRLAGDPLAGRTVLLQRRPVGGSSWTAHGQLGAGTTAGSYRLTVTPADSYEWRVRFANPGGEGLLSASSAIVRVTVTGNSCTTSPCPL
jgi:hypothetical protein